MGIGAGLGGGERAAGMSPPPSSGGEVGGRMGDGGVRATEFHRIRILRAAVKLAGEAVAGERVAVVEIVETAGVSRGTFYALFEDREDCLRAAIEEGVALAEVRAAAGASRSDGTWVDRIRRGLRALLELGDEEPDLARFCLARALVERYDVRRLDHALARVERCIDEGRSAPGAVAEPPALAMRGVLGGVLGATYARLLSGSGSLAELESGLMGMIVLPYLGGRAARREERRANAMDLSTGRTPSRQPRALNGNQNGNGQANGTGLRMTYRTMRVLETVGAQGGLSNQDVAKRAGILDQGQVSKLLARLAGLELVENNGVGQARGGANAWSLTEAGEMLMRSGKRSEAVRA